MAVKVFISYAHNDEHYKNELVKHLAALQRSGVIEEWNDRQITVGQSWDDEIKTAMNEAQLFLLLVSSDFIASDYINNKEIAEAFEKGRRNEAKIVPVIIRPCDFDDTPLAQFQAVPTNAKPISTW